MARKRESQVYADILRGKFFDLEFLKENGEFRADIDRLNEMPNKGPREVRARARETTFVGKKWNLSHLPVTERIDVNHLFLSLPVSAKIEGREAVVRIKLDLGGSVDDLCVLTVQTLRQLLRLNGFSNKSRRRFSEARFQLEVFRLAKGKLTFKQIAQKLKRSINSVRSAYDVAREKIGDSALPAKRKLHMAKLARFNPKNHFATCPVCSRGENFCELAESYANQDQISRRERLSEGRPRPKRPNR